MVEGRGPRRELGRTTSASSVESIADLNHNDLCVLLRILLSWWPVGSDLRADRICGEIQVSCPRNRHAFRRRSVGCFSRRSEPDWQLRRAYLNRYVRSEQRRKSANWPTAQKGWLEKGPSESLFVRYVSQRICSSLTPRIQTLLKPTICLLLMTRCTSQKPSKGDPAVPSRPADRHQVR